MRVLEYYSSWSERDESGTTQDEGATSTLRRIVQLPLFRWGLVAILR
jgi:hypothetical protein